MGPAPKNCITNASKICQFSRFGLHPYKLATLRATIGLIITSCYCRELVKIRGLLHHNSLLIHHNSLLLRHINVCGPQ